jgi:hypothetical protein
LALRRVNRRRSSRLAGDQAAEVAEDRAVATMMVVVAAATMVVEAAAATMVVEAVEVQMMNLRRPRQALRRQPW